MIDKIDIIFSMFSKENNDSTISLERVLTTDQRNELPDSAFGLPKQRKYPLYTKDGKPDEKHIKSAMAYFKYCPEKDRKTLANNILKAARKANIEFSKTAQWYKYTSEYEK